MKQKKSFWEIGMKLGNIYGCHQIYERSFSVRGCQFPVCARCTGVIAGYVIFGMTAWIYTLPGYMGILFMLVMLSDWLIQRFHLKESTNVRRFITGMLCGYGILIVAKTIITLLVERIGVYANIV